jgi:beta-glucanase (GH16 family)
MISEKLLNIWLQLKSFVRFIFHVKPNLKKPKAVNNYKIAFSDFFIGHNLDENKWSISQPWGDFHPDYLHQYYGKDESFVSVEDGCLNLYSRYKPKKFYDFKKNINIIIPYGVGLIVSKNTFKYGYYEINGILPTGKLLWPAIWLTAEKTWPPEIDIVEAYSGKRSDYSNQFGIPFVKFQPNIHYGFVEDKTKASYGAKDYPIPFKPSQRSVTYAVHWTEKFIKFYYDGYLVFQTEKKEILDYFNKEGVNMNIILNNAYHPDVDGTKYDPSIFKINYVKFFAKN